MATRVAVPETSVDEDHLLLARKDKVRLSREVRPVKAEAVAEGVDQSTNLDLGFRIRRFDAAHQPAARVRNVEELPLGDHFTGGAPGLNPNICSNIS